MKNWKFIKVENKDTPELREKLRDIDEQIKNWEHAKGIDGVEKANAQKTIDDLKKERSKIQQEITTGNESIGKQEWSMFKGLAKDAEKEVGNESIGDEYNAEIHRLEKKKMDLERMGQGQKAREIEKQIQQLQKELREYDIGNKKTGNGALDYKIVRPKSQPAKYKVGDEVKTNKGKGKILKVQPMMLSPTPTYLIELDNGSKEWRYEEEIGNKKVGNAYTPNPELIKVLEAWLHNRMSEQEARAKIMKITGDKNITDMMIHSPGGFIPAGNKKTGNARPKEQLLADVRELTKYIQEHNGQGCEKEKRLLGEAKEELDKNYGILVNNLCRARNAIKTKNSDVTLWKDNDTVYIKEDGHVQYLENNSFVVDEDKYDSQEKAIEDLTKKGYHKK